MAITIIFITRGRSWEYRPILPLDGQKDAGFYKWYDLHAKMDFRSPEEINQIQEINYQRHKFFYLASMLDSGSYDESDRPIPIYFALVSKYYRELADFPQNNIEDIKSILLQAQNELHDVPYSDQLDTKCISVANDIAQKYLGSSARRGLHKPSKAKLTFALFSIVFFSVALAWLIR